MKSIFLVHDGQESPAERANLLETAGYTVTLFPKAQDAVKRLAEQLPSLLIMDVLLPGHTGFEVCRRIRTRYSVDRLPIVLMSRFYRSSAFRAEAERSGSQEYLLRPVEVGELLNCIERLTSDMRQVG